MKAGVKQRILAGAMVVPLALAMSLAMLIGGGLALAEESGITAQSLQPVEMYRLYNPNSGEHFYTADETEMNGLVKLGWKYEGIGWFAPEESDTPVYRLYNANGSEHHYTTSADERDMLVKAGWSDEGIGWYSDDYKTVPLHREYNPNAFSCNHNYTMSDEEHDGLVKLGWKDEGIAWYGMGFGS